MKEFICYFFLTLLFGYLCLLISSVISFLYIFFLNLTKGEILNASEYLLFFQSDYIQNMALYVIPGIALLHAILVRK